MIGGLRFALARARAALPPLITLAVVAAIAAALVVAAIGAVRSAEAREVRAAIDAAAGDLGRTIVAADAATAEPAIRGILAERGLAEAVAVAVDDGIVITPDLGRITGDDVPRLTETLTGLSGSLRERGVPNAQVSGMLPTTLEAIGETMEARRGPTAVAIGLLGLMTAIVVGAVALETVRAREGENLLLRARGARRRDLVWLSALETFAVALVGAIVGAAAALVLVGLIGGVSAGLPAAGIATAAVAVVAAVVALVGTYRGIDRGSARARAAADIGVIVVVAVVTAVAAWQFWQVGTPVVQRGDGSVILDPLVAIAPALVLALAALIAVAVATPIARLVAASLSRTRSVSPVTPLRLASRRPARHALSIVVVAFAIGATTVAGTYHSSLTALGSAPEELRVGADARVSTIPEDVDISAIAATQPSNAAMLVRPFNAQGADRRLPILAAGAAELGEVMLDAGGTIDPRELTDLLAVTDAGVAVTGTLSFTLSTVSPPPVVIDGVEREVPPAAVFGRVTLLAPDGSLTRIGFANFDETELPGRGRPTSLEVDPQYRASLELPELAGGGAWSLVGIDLGAHPDVFMGGGAQITGMTDASGPVDLTGFRAAPGTPGGVETTPDGLAFDLETGSPGFAWTRSITDGIPSPIPAVVTAAVAESMSLEVDEEFSLRIVTPKFDADFVVAGIIPVLPGTATGEGFLVDLPTLSLLSPEEIVPNQVWFSSDDPAALAENVEAAFPPTVTVVANTQAAQNAAGTAIAFVLAALGAVLLALVVLVLRRTRSRADSRELALFAVMGLGRTRASRVRAAEDLFAVVMGVVGGIAAGAATAWLIVPPLVRAAYGRVPDAYPVPLQVDGLVLGAALVLATLLFAAIVATVRTPTRLAPLLREDE